MVYSPPAATVEQWKKEWRRLASLHDRSKAVERELNGMEAKRHRLKAELAAINGATLAAERKEAHAREALRSRR